MYPTYAPAGWPRRPEPSHAREDPGWVIIMSIIITNAEWRAMIVAVAPPLVAERLPVKPSPRLPAE